MSTDDEKIQAISLQKWATRGVFLKVDVDVNISSGKKPNLESKEVITQTKVDGETVHIKAKDYAMGWKSHAKPGLPSTTHELCFDKVNGFDPDFVYVSGVTVNMIARVSKSNPERQQLFQFPDSEDGKDAEPHTLIFSNIKSDEQYGKLYVGLEEQGLIVRLDMTKILAKYGGKMESTPSDSTYEHVTLDPKTDYDAVYDVRMKGESIPYPINTRPHGFCFDATGEYIYFTGKLTNTVGRIKITGGSQDEIQKTLQHFELPTLGAVPIYVALGPDNNIWGTCLANSMIFRATTGDNPTIDEMTISHVANDRRPIAIKADPRKFSNGKARQFMWFTTEAGHSVCRLDTVAFEKEIERERLSMKRTCQCSTGCKILFRGSKFKHPIITEFPIPKINRKMKVGGVALDSEGAVYVQSYVDPSQNDEDLPDYIIKMNFQKHDPTSTHSKGTGRRVNMTGLPIEYYELPTKNTILHRISVGPDDSVWFTELGADRLGTIEVADPKSVVSSTKKRKAEDGNGNGGENKKIKE